MIENRTGARCLVLGAGGFIGGNLLAALADRGVTIRAFGRRPRLPCPVVVDDWIDAEFNNRTAIAASLDGVSHVFHLLGGSDASVHNTHPAAELANNIEPSLALFDACVAAKVERLVFVSSGGTVYGPGASTPTHENAPTDPISAYGVGKLAIEKFLAVYRRHQGLDSCVLRVANPFGPLQLPGRGQGFIAHAMRCALSREPLELWGDGSVVRDFIFIDDVVAAIIAGAFCDSDEKLFNIGSGIPRSLNEVIDDIGYVAGRAPEVRRIASRPSDVPISLLDCTRAGEQLGWRSETNWMTALERTRRWIELNEGC